MSRQCVSWWLPKGYDQRRLPMGLSSHSLAARAQATTSAEQPEAASGLGMGWGQDWSSFFSIDSVMIRTGNENQSQTQPWDGQEGLWEQGWHPQGECQVQSEPWGNRVRSRHKPGEPQVNSSSQDLECLSCSHPLLLHCQGTSLQGGQQKRRALSAVPDKLRVSHCRDPVPITLMQYLLGIMAILLPHTFPTEWCCTL